jgi:hypothetical protein
MNTHTSSTEANTGSAHNPIISLKTLETNEDLIAAIGMYPNFTLIVLLIILYSS